MLLQLDKKDLQLYGYFFPSQMVYWGIGKFLAYEEQNRITVHLMACQNNIIDNQALLLFTTFTKNRPIILRRSKPLTKYKKAKALKVTCHISYVEKVFAYQDGFLNKNVKNYIRFHFLEKGIPDILD